MEKEFYFVIYSIYKFRDFYGIFLEFLGIFFYFFSIFTKKPLK